jgi:hypothetical protein
LSLEEEFLYTNISVDVFPLNPSYVNVNELPLKSTTNNEVEFLINNKTENLTEEEQKKHRKKREADKTDLKEDGTRSQWQTIGNQNQNIKKEQEKNEEELQNFE